MNVIALQSLRPDALPAIIAEAGPSAEERFLEFFTATLRNPNTRIAYWHACTQFLAWCGEYGTALAGVGPIHVAGYIERLGRAHSAPTVKQHLAAIRSLFDWMVVGQIIRFNPAAPVRGPKHVVSEGKTPVLSDDETRALFAQFDPSKLIDARDRAIIAVMVYSFARVSALTKLAVKDYYRQGARAWFLLSEKGGKRTKAPAHHMAAEYVEQYLALAGVSEARDTPLFRSLKRVEKGGHRVSDRGMLRGNVFAMIRRRALAVGLPIEIGCHSFRGTGITNYLSHGGTLENAARIAGHASTKTTQLYDRRRAEVEQAEIERIRF